jgi:general secretion pathway protein F
MPTFHYRALTKGGEAVAGSLDASSLAEVNRRVEYLGLIPIEAATARSEAMISRSGLALARPQPEDVTNFTRDLALLMRAGQRINDALELLAADVDLGRMRPTVTALAGSVLSGESFGEAVSLHPRIFPPIYLALIRVGETSGALVAILEALVSERQRAEALSRRLTDALRYPAFLLFAAGAVLIFFLTFVLPQFANMFHDFNAQPDWMLEKFMGFSEFLRSNSQVIAAALLCALAGAWLSLRRPSLRRPIMGGLARLPVVRPIMEYRRTSLFCRNLSLMILNGVALPSALRILAQTMETTGAFMPWSMIVDKVRHGGRLSDALTATGALPQTAIRTLRLGEDSGQLPMLAGRIADFYEAKLERSLDRAIGVVGPLAIIVISVIVGGLIISVMTALLSVYQVVN